VIGRYAFGSDSGLVNVVLGEGLKMIGEGAFSSCYSPSIVYYQGSAVISTSYVFGYSCTVCVPPDYGSDYFCGIQVKPIPDKCATFKNQFDGCHKGALDDDGSITQKNKKKAEEWERRTNGCMKYECSDDAGLLSWSLCNNNETEPRMCVIDKCIEGDAADSVPKFFVEVEFYEGTVNVTDLDTDDVIDTLRIDFGIDTNDIRAGWESDARGYAIRMLIYVPDEAMAKSVSIALNQLKDDGDGIFSRAKSIRIVAWSQIFSGATKASFTSVLLITMVLTLLMTMF